MRFIEVYTSDKNAYNQVIPLSEIKCISQKVRGEEHFIGIETQDRLFSFTELPCDNRVEYHSLYIFLKDQLNNTQIGLIRITDEIIDKISRERDRILLQRVRQAGEKGILIKDLNKRFFYDNECIGFWIDEKNEEFIKIEVDGEQDVSHMNDEEYNAVTRVWFIENN